MNKNKRNLNQVFIIKNEVTKDRGGKFLVMNDNLKKEEIQNCCSFSKKKYTLSGLHFQKKPHQEQKIITCIKGSIFDVVVNINKKSKDYLKWNFFYLNEINQHSLFIGKDYAHGFMTLTDDTIVSYQIIGNFYSKFQSGIAWNDNKINIQWPEKPKIISPRDKNFTHII